MALNTILLKGERVMREAQANAAITPGHLVETMSTGKIRKHSTAAGNAKTQFAVENELAAKEISVDYAADDTCFYMICDGCNEVNALVAAAAPAITRGDFLESAGDGTLRKVVVAAATSSAQRNSVVAIALESVDNSGGGTPVRLKVEVL
jgi:hypothetical protein